MTNAWSGGEENPGEGRLDPRPDYFAAAIAAIRLSPKKTDPKAGHLDTTIEPRRLPRSLLAR